MQSEPTTHEIKLLRAVAGEIFIDSWGSWMTEAAESLKARGYCTGAPNYHVTEAGVAFLARMKEPTTFRFVYRNHRGEIAERRVIPDAVRFGTTEWHPTPQWLLRAYDLDKQALREFAMSEISSVLANRKEVMPHTAEQPARPVQGCSSPRRDTTPPQASEPGVTDPIVCPHYNEHAEIWLEPPCQDEASEGRLWVQDGDQFDPCPECGADPVRFVRADIHDAEIRRLRAVEAEHAARIAALEAGLQPFAKFGQACRTAPADFIITMGSLMAAAQLRVRDCREAARLLNLPQEGR
jgi:hypothetical protein